MRECRVRYARCNSRLPARGGRVQREHRTHCDLRADLEPQSEQCHNSLDDRQFETIAVTRAVGRHADLIELVVDVRELVRGDTDTGIGHLEADQGLRGRKAARSECI